MRVIFGLLGLLLSTHVFAKEYVENLPAGGKTIIRTEFDRYEVNCTAEPQTPIVISKTCTCTQYDVRPFTGMWRYKLDSRTLLSNGKVVEMSLTDGLATRADCENAKADSYAGVCPRNNR